MPVHLVVLAVLQLPAYPLAVVDLSAVAVPLVGPLQVLELVFTGA